MEYQSIEEWKNEIKAIFKQQVGSSDYYCQNQADTFEMMYEGYELHELPSPQECFDMEMDAAAPDCT